MPSGGVVSRLADLIVSGRVDRSIADSARIAEGVGRVRARADADPEFAAQIATVDADDLIHRWNAESWANDRKVMDNMSRLLAQGPIRCPVFDVTGVHDAMKDRNVLLPAMRPPFDQCWTEYTVSRSWSGGKTIRVGAMFWTQPWDDPFDSAGGDVAPQLWAELDAAHGHRAVWCVSALGGFEKDGVFTLNRTLWMWALDEHGDAIGYAGRRVDVDIEEDDGMLVAAFAFAFSLMNCGNVEFVDHEPPPRLQRARRRRRQEPLVSYRTLVIRPPGAARRQTGPGAPDDGGEALRFHIRRGHFADYRNGRGLFGREDLRRVFWMSPTLVGSKDTGEVVKDYRVEP